MKDLCKEMNEFGKGISNQCRYQILESLLAGEKSVNELVKTVGVSQPAVSQHLKTLKSSGLVIDKRQGQEIIYSANSKYLLSLLKDLTDQVKEGEKQHA